MENPALNEVDIHQEYTDLPLLKMPLGTLLGEWKLTMTHLIQDLGEMVHGETPFHTKLSYFTGRHGGRRIFYVGISLVLMAMCLFYFTSIA